MIACVQRLTTFGIVVCATFFLFLFWETSRITAWAAFCAILLSHCIVLALQFAVLPWVNSTDAVPRATVKQLLFAWLQESVAAAQVFSWWQPFCARRFPNQLNRDNAIHGIRGVVLVHGFLCNRAVWMRWLPELARRKIPFIAVNLEPIFGSIDSYIATVDRAVKEMLAATGQPPLLVCHSMGGLAARAWYQSCGMHDSAIYHIVTIGSPHHGTRIGSRFPKMSWIKNADQMHHGSRWLAALEQTETAAQRKRFTCFYSNCDNIVMPSSTAKMEGADNRFVVGVPHVAMALDVDIMRETMAILGDISPR